MRWLAIITILIFELLYSQPIVRILYPRVDSMIDISGIETYIQKASFSQPLDPLREIARVEIIDSTTDSIYFKSIKYRYHYIDPTDSTRFTDYRFCWDSSTLCPCKIIVTNCTLLPNKLSDIRSGINQSYSLEPCSTITIPPDTVLPFYVSKNIHLERISPHVWNLYFGIWHIDTLVSPKKMSEFGYSLSPICNDSGECTPPDEHLYYFSFLLPSINPTFHFYYIPKPGTTFLNYLPSRIAIDISLYSTDNIPYYFFPLDSTSAWFIIRFETITRDTFIDTVRYGDPGTFWIVPPGKHIGWRRFGVMTMYTDIPSRGYTGVVEVCLMDVTNGPVIAFGEPTHLHPEGVSCYEDWVYIDSVTGDTTVIPDIIPAPPEPVCWRFGIISEVSEAERGVDELNLEVVGGYLSPIQVFYKISGVGHLELYDITGKVVLRREISAKGSEKIGIDKLNSGVYFIRVVNGKRSVVRKVLVVR